MSSHKRAAEEPEVNKMDEKEEGELDQDESIPDRVEKRKAKKKMKKMKQEDENPSFELRTDSEGIKTKDLRDLILHIYSNTQCPKWINLKKKQDLKSVVVLMASEMSPEFAKELLSDLDIFPSRCPIQGPGEKKRIHSPIQALMQCPLTKEEREEQKANAAKIPAHVTADYYLLAEDAMIENMYPMKGDTTYIDFVETQLISETPDIKICAVDCEMCFTDKGLELARISVIGEDLNPIYDTLVKPHNPIIDYNTKFSGITEEMMEEVETRIEDVHSFFHQYISNNTILVGHSLENDLRAMKMIHSRVIDTALIYSHTRGPPFKPGLKWLCEKYLNRHIQKGEDGHDSLEDAKATMELVKLKLKNGPNFGQNLSDTIPITERLAKFKVKCAMADTRNVVNSNAKAGCLGKPCSNDEEIVKSIAEFIPQSSFIFGRLTSLETIYRESNDPPANKLGEIANSFKEYTKKIYDSLPENGLFIFASGHGKIAPARKLMASKNSRKKVTDFEASTTDLDNGWGEDEEKEMENLIKSGRQGVCYFCIKSSK